METDNLEGIVYNQTIYDICYEQTVSHPQKCIDNNMIQYYIKSYREMMGGNEGIHGIKKKDEGK
jgi:hypothetical protein